MEKRGRKEKRVVKGDSRQRWRNEKKVMEGGRRRKLRKKKQKKKSVICGHLSNSVNTT